MPPAVPKEFDSIRKSMKKLRAVEPKEDLDLRIARIESILGYPVPPQYRYWASICGECYVESETMTFMTDCWQKDQRFVQHHKSELKRILTTLHWLRPFGIPLAVDGFGNYFMLHVHHPMQPVVFVEGTSADTISYVVSSSLERFLALVCESLKHPYDEQTEYLVWTDRDFLMKHDPDLAKCNDLPYVWSDSQ